MITFVELNGTRLAYEHTGTGQPLVFIHGNTLDVRMWNPQWDVFARDFTVVRYDIRGHGQSANPTGPFSHADDLLALITHLNLGPAHLIGLSRGGGIALDLAVEHPEAVRSIVSVDSTLWGYRQWDTEALQFWQKVNETAQHSGLEAARALWLTDPMFAHANTLPAVAGQLRVMVADYAGWQWLNRNPERLPSPSTLERLSGLAQPILALAGELDRPDFITITGLLAEHARAQKVILPGVGHMPNMEAPELFNQTVLGFLRRA